MMTAQLIEAFSLAYLSPRYDNPQPVPKFHRECWERYCSSHPACATAAPRSHAKSTALTHAYVLANVCWREETYVIVLGASEEKAMEHLGDIALELRENEELRRDFKIKSFVQDVKTDIIVECTDGHQFRIVARGSEQKIRGTKWRGRRPGLIVGDDLEDDEQVENKERRKKFQRWFFRAAKQSLRKGGRIRVHGTILNRDALLAHLMHNAAWDSRRYQAHRGINDFSDILWPEQFSRARLQAIKTEFVAEGDTAGYSQEYLNDPRESEYAYLQKAWFGEMREEDRDEFMVLGVGCDFAVSTEDTANRTAFSVGGKRLDNRKAVIDQRVGRWDAKEWIDEMFAIEEQYKPQWWFVEDGVIWKAVWPTVREEMKSRDTWLNILPIKRTKDKATSGRPFQKECRMGAWLFDKLAPWWPDLEEELLDFSPEAEAKLDDQFDSIVNLCRGFEEVAVEDGDEVTEEENEFIRESERLRGGDGRSPVTGY